MSFRWIGLFLLFPLFLVAETSETVVRLKNDRGGHGSGVIIGPGAVLTVGHVLSNIDNGGMEIVAGQGTGSKSMYVAAYRIALGKRPGDHDREEIMQFATHDVAVLVFPGNPFRREASLVQPDEDNKIFIGAKAEAIGYKTKNRSVYEMRANGFWPNQWTNLQTKTDFEKKFGKESIMYFLNPIGQNQRSGDKMPGPDLAAVRFSIAEAESPESVLFFKRPGVPTDIFGPAISTSNTKTFSWRLRLQKNDTRKRFASL